MDSFVYKLNIKKTDSQNRVDSDLDSENIKHALGK